VRYAPSLSLAGDVASFTWTVEIGARLKRNERFGDVRFGREGLVGAAVARDLGVGFSLAVESFVLPALSRDESVTGDETPVLIRRVPAEAIASLAWQHRGSRLVLGAGTSVPLTDRTSGTRRETLSGPPGAALRVAFGLEQAF
jgi:hypothetical protein